ncbi:hypothetical protein ABEY43_25445 [Priestia megaterium]|uniref:hypothetical protein n=1 Tax=Priestia megaterium TaxID=1404 RepID=UPI0015DBD928|nr:hypothetical protein [Priestia megaterium]QLK09317.1 hypothetical protein BMG_6089 [Priestia megaterium]
MANIDIVHLNKRTLNRSLPINTSKRFPFFTEEFKVNLTHLEYIVNLNVEHM